MPLSNNLPAGFVLDDETGSNTGLPEGFVLDAPEPVQDPQFGNAPIGTSKWPEPQQMDLLQRERDAKARGSFEGTEMTSTTEGGQALDNFSAFQQSAQAELYKALGVTQEIFQPFTNLTRGRLPKNPGDTYKEFLTYLKANGYPTEEYESAAGRLGTNTVDNILFTLMGLGAAKAVGAALPPQTYGNARSAVQQIFGRNIKPGTPGFAGRTSTRNFVEGMSAAPGQQLGAAATGSVGQALGQALSGDDLAAGTVGYALTGWPGATVMRMGGALAKRGYGMFGNKEVDALFPLDPLLPAATAQKRIDAHVTYIEHEMQKQIADIQPYKMVGRRKVPLSPQEADDRLNAAVDDVYEKTRQIEDTYWTAVNPKQMVVTDDIKAQIIAYRDRMHFEESAKVIPDDFIEEIREMPAVVPATRVLGITRSLYGARRSMLRNPDFRGDKERAAQLMLELEDRVREGLSKEVDNPQALADARAFTAQRKELFNEGPMGAARYAERRLGEEYTKPLTQQILSRHGGVDQLLNVDRFAKGQGMTSTILEDFDSAFKAVIAEAQLGRPVQGIDPATPDPGKLKSFVDKYAYEIKNAGKLLQELDTTTMNLINLQQMHDRAQKSVWAQYAKHPDSSVGHIINNNNPDMVKDAIQGARLFLDPKNANVVADPAGLRAYQSQVAMALNKMAGTEPQRLSKLLERSDVASMLKGVFRTNPDALARYQRIVKAAATEDINRGGVPTFLRALGVFGARISGAQLGRKISPGTLQGPSIISESFRRGITGYLNRRFPSAPENLLAWAMFSPEGEKWLLQRVPSNAAELRKSIIFARRWMTVFNNSMGELVHRRDPDGRLWKGHETPPGIADTDLSVPNPEDEGLPY